MILARYQIPLLWVCQLLFMMRVFGQIYVVLYGPAWLPPMEEWYSGLLPYRFLLPLQVLIIFAMTKVAYDNMRKKGSFYIVRPKVKTILKTISMIYFLIMVLRYGITMIYFPEKRWFEGTIPIFFHFILAFYIYLLTQNNAKEQP